MYCTINITWSYFLHLFIYLMNYHKLINLCVLKAIKKSADHSKCQIINRCLSLKSGVNLSLLSASRFKSELLLDYVAKWQSISDMQWIYSNRRVVLMIHLSRSLTKSPFGFKSRKKNLFYFFKFFFPYQVGVFIASS